MRNILVINSKTNMVESILGKVYDTNSLEEELINCMIESANKYAEFNQMWIRLELSERKHTK